MDLFNDLLPDKDGPTKGKTDGSTNDRKSNDLLPDKDGLTKAKTDGSKNDRKSKSKATSAEYESSKRIQKPSSKEDSSKKKEVLSDRPSTSSCPSPDAISELSAVMRSNFQNSQSLFEGCIGNNLDVYFDYEDCGYEGEQSCEVIGDSAQKDVSERDILKRCRVIWTLIIVLGMKCPPFHSLID